MEGVTHGVGGGPAEVRALGTRLSNWGRWGPDDERGATNLITPDRVVAAAALVRTGKVFDLGIPFDESGPQTGTGIRQNPLHLMSATGTNQDFAGGFRYTDDIVVMALQCATQWDALAHVFYDDQLYNGYPATEVTTRGALKDAIDRQAKGITGRGVLLDIARLLDVPWLEPGYAITAGDLDAACAAQGVELGSGDILMVRTGWRRMFVETADRAAFMGSEPGLGLTCCEWLRDRDVAVVCADNWALEAVPAVDPSVRMPVHMVLIRDMGVTLGEMFDFEELAADCASDGVWECFFCGPPLKVTRGVGSPINPLAIK